MRTALTVLLVLCICFLIVEFMHQEQNYKLQQEQNWIAKLTTQQQQSIYQTTTRQKISITRMGGAIEVRYLGGQDKGFIGDFRITIDNETKYYKNPGPYNPIAMIEHWEHTCVDVEAMDKAVQTYRPIGSACV